MQKIREDIVMLLMDLAAGSLMAKGYLQHDLDTRLRDYLSDFTVGGVWCRSRGWRLCGCW